MEQYKDPIIKEMEKRAKEVGGHGGMDFIMDSRLIYCLHNGLPLDMDVYDLAEWCSLIPLTKLSIENGSVPVEIPDFTRGAWNKIQGYSMPLPNRTTNYETDFLYHLLTLALLLCGMVMPSLQAQPYKNPSLSPEERTADLLQRMTLEEK